MKQSTRVMNGMGLAWAGVSALLLGLGVACDRKPGVPKVALPPGVTAPTTREREAEAEAEILSRFEAVPLLGQGEGFKSADGELWIKYPSGLMIHDLKPGDGREPGVGQTLTVNYVGSIPGTGVVFDKSAPDKPFKLTYAEKAGVIKGWTLGLSTMKVGGRRRLYIPANLAYGEKGSPPKIGSNQDLIFEVELLSATGERYNLPQPSTSTGPATLPILGMAGPSSPPASPTSGGSAPSSAPSPGSAPAPRSP